MTKIVESPEYSSSGEDIHSIIYYNAIFITNAHILNCTFIIKLDGYFSKSLGLGNICGNVVSLRLMASISNLIAPRMCSLAYSASAFLFYVGKYHEPSKT